jgi:protoporphyrinogen oxidase
MPKHVVILGGGLTGLACGYELATRGHAVTVLEREPHVGGMASSFVEEGDERWCYDLGPHRLYGGSDAVARQVEEILGHDVVQARRRSRIRLFDRFFDYPLDAKNVLANMPRRLLWKALLDYATVVVRDRLGRSRLADDTFEGWATRRFGRTLYHTFFGQYTEKVWGIPAARLSADWAGQRISLQSLWDTIVKSAFGAKRRARDKLADVFVYPRHGGIGAVARGYARRIEELGGRVLVSSPAVVIHRDGPRVTGVRYGRHRRVELQGDEYVSTIPIVSLVRALSPRAPDEVLRAAAALSWVSLLCVYLKLARPQVSSASWIYLPEKHLTVHRVTEFKNFSPHCAPPGKTLVCAEITCRRGDRLWRASGAELGEIAARDLESAGLIERGEVIEAFAKRIPHAYPVFDVDYARHLAPVVDFANELQNIHTTGRQGRFGYDHMLQAIEMGQRVGLEVATNEQGRHRARAAGSDRHTARRNER